MTTTTDADRVLKARHRALWASGDYPAVATEVIPALGPALVEAARVRPGQRVLDVAAGAGNAAIPAALTGAEVVAADLAPELFEAGRRSAERAGVTLTWTEADAEALPFADGEFDTVLSCVGVMFAPHHQATADELVRVTRSGGTIALANWTPEGFIGRMFATLRPYAAPPPAGAQPPPLWGDPEHVRGLLGDRVTDVTAQRRILPVSRFTSGEEFRDFFKATYGPTIAVYDRLAGAGDDTAVAQLDEALAELGDEYFSPGTRTMEWEYLLFTARRR
ncbi:class I SAM-dependent methyltransferase [Prauserella muralis]|uniref:Uncharacterized protein n=1 Tax=Prauserella muralis TaxID=588067 RepID=A0A2V4B1L3_9PSEU|nr:class I SAM-dependent methyltransferase [Prauserella muralis]PXY27927.1 hypothetical protein BAY60_16365 [Prauserella muralis]TWE22292.1 methyltransferase family protein [Prauserella muralis]